MPKIPSQETTFIGIDPGHSGGGLAALYGFHVEYAAMSKMSEKDIWDWFNAIKGEKVAVIEKVWATPDQGAVSGFSFGMNYGFLRACLHATKTKFIEVIPVNWMKGLNLPPRKKGAPKKEGKELLRSQAQQRFPNLELWTPKKRTNRGEQMAVADALLIASYCRKVHNEGLL